MKHGLFCPPVTPGSSFMGTKLNVDAQQAATLTLGVSLVKGLISACMTGKLDGFSDSLNVAADMTGQAIAHPKVYHGPKGP